jgi:hypothetical protein
MSRKLCLVVVDSLRTDTLLQAASDDDAPAFAALLERGSLVPDCVSSFPTVTPVCTAEIATGEGPGPLPSVAGSGHWISGMNWYDRLERRYVEYGTSFEATRTFGLFRSLYDIVYNMNMAHLSHEVDTIFERLGDAGVRTACTPFLIYRGRTRHELGLEGLMKRMAAAASFRHATWGPDELFWGELYASRRVPCKPTLARPGTRDSYSACVGQELVREDLYDFLLYSLPDHDYHSHRTGPGDTAASIAHADRCFADLADAAGGIDAFCEANAVILMADHGQTDVEHGVDLAAALAGEWRVLEPNDPRPEAAELAVAPTSRAAGIYVLASGSRRLRAHADVRSGLAQLDGCDLLAWFAAPGGEPLERDGAGPVRREDVEAVVEAPGRDAALRFRPGSSVSDRRGRGWDLEGDLEALDLEVADGELTSDTYPDALARLWSALAAPQAPDVIVSLALGYECVDWGGMSHVGGGSHGSLHAEDSLVPLLLCGFEPGIHETRAQWKLCDVAGLILSHFGLADEGPLLRSAKPAASAGSAL